MGIFSFLGKKERQPDLSEDSKTLSRPNREGDASRIGSPNRSSPRNSQQRDAARATAEKIDAIESEMTSELARPTKKLNGKAGSAVVRKPVTAMTAANGEIQNGKASILPAMGLTTDFLMGSESRIGHVEISSSEIPPVIEESAILFANEQYDMVEQMLQGALHDAALGEAIHTVWLMLLDLYQITGKQDKFEQLSLAYAAKFETSPPAWDSGRLDMQQPESQPSGATPALTFSGKLDESIVKQLERAQKLSEKGRALRVEFTRVTEVLPSGCELLLAALKKLQKAGYELILVGAPEFANKIRSIIEVGRRDETEAPWLLLLEVLQLLNREHEFEETSIDYCITFEVSPPAFVAPKKVSMATEELTEPETEKFMMPAVIDGRSNVISTVSEFVLAKQPAVIDCSRLVRVDFTAAGQLLTTLAPLAGQGRIAELHHVNHLVGALFQVMGLRDIARILPRKN